MSFLTLLLCSEKNITRRCIDEVIKKSNEGNIRHIIVRPDKIVNHIHLVQALTASKRNRKIGLRIAKKPEIDVICYICCTDSINDALNECVDDLGRCILIITFSDDSASYEELKKCQNKLVEDIIRKCNIDNIDIAICTSCYRKVEPPKECRSGDIKDILERLVELVLDRIE